MRFDSVINLKIANSLGITLQITLLGHVDDVIISPLMVEADIRAQTVTSGVDPNRTLARSKFRTAASTDLLLTNAICCPAVGWGYRCHPID